MAYQQQSYAQQQKNLAQVNAVNIMKGVIASPKVKDRMNELLGKESSAFLSSVLDLYSSDGYLAKCNAADVMTECMKAAALKLPISKSLGFAYVVPYGNKPQFTLGYKGMIQLAQRTGQYKYINADMVYEGEMVKNDRITGMVQITGEAKSENVIGYFAYFQLLNGFEKCIYWTREKVMTHAQRYSKSFNQSGSAWQTNFDAMALKTVLRNIISKYGIMSIEMVNAISNDDEVENEVAQNANAKPIVLPENPPEIDMDTANPADNSDESNGVTVDNADPEFSSTPDF